MGWSVLMNEEEWRQYFAIREDAAVIQTGIDAKTLMRVDDPGPQMYPCLVDEIVATPPKHKNPAVYFAFVYPDAVQTLNAALKRMPVPGVPVHARTVEGPPAVHDSGAALADLAGITVRTVDLLQDLVAKQMAHDEILVRSGLCCKEGLERLFMAIRSDPDRHTGTAIERFRQGKIELTGVDLSLEG